MKTFSIKKTKTIYIDYMEEDFEAETEEEALDMARAYDKWNQDDISDNEDEDYEITYESDDEDEPDDPRADVETYHPKA